MAVTQKDIAEHLGLSRSVVALALNGYGRVADETRQRVRDAAIEMGYDANANLAARSLVAKRHARPARTGVLAVMTLNLTNSQRHGPGVRDFPFYADMLNGIESEAARQERDVFICTPRNGSLPRFIEDRMVDGIIVFDTDALALIRDVALPRLVVSMPNSEAPFLAPTERQGIYQATRHLLELGHRNIIFLGTNATQATMKRAEGYREAMEEQGLPFAAHECDGASVAVARKMDELLRRRCAPQSGARGGARAGRAAAEDPTACFTAVVARNDAMAMTAIETIQSHGLKVPEDISVTGFDDVTPQYHFAPLITSVRFDRYAMGKRAVELLCDEGCAVPAHGGAVNAEYFETEFVVRESTAPLKPGW